MHIPLEQWHAKVRLQGVLDRYTLRLRLPGLDDVPGQDGAPGQDDRAPAAPAPPRHGEPATSHLPSIAIAVSTCSSRPAAARARSQHPIITSSAAASSACSKVRIASRPAR
jgi:hypothetical protein